RTLPATGRQRIDRRLPGTRSAAPGLPQARPPARPDLAGPGRAGGGPSGAAVSESPLITAAPPPDTPSKPLHSGTSMSQSPHTLDVTGDTFDQLVIENSRHKPVLVDSWADWCAPCKALMPMLASITESFGGELLLAKVNCDAEVFLTERFGIRSLPTVVLF